ncbi:MAG TPA: hypothetical protein VHP83_05720 [Aggregatilineaceae bacterium]|nr:hypothetical protein [Aggregatilineaceae bacterium]
MGGDVFSGDSLFWLIHIFFGIAVPFMIYWACCREDAGEQPESQSKPH